MFLSQMNKSVPALWPSLSCTMVANCDSFIGSWQPWSPDQLTGPSSALDPCLGDPVMEDDESSSLNQLGLIILCHFRRRSPVRDRFSLSWQVAGGLLSGHTVRQKISVMHICLPPCKPLLSTFSCLERLCDWVHKGLNICFLLCVSKTGDSVSAVMSSFLRTCKVS